MTDNCITLCCLPHLTFADQTQRSTVLQMDSNMISIEKPKFYCSSKNTPFKVKKYPCQQDKIHCSREFNSQNITEKQTENPDYIPRKFILQSKKSNSRIREVIEAMSFQNAVSSLQFTIEQSIAFQNAVCNLKYFTVCLHTKGAKTIGVGLRGQTTTHVKIYSLVWKIRPPPPHLL